MILDFDDDEALELHTRAHLTAALEKLANDYIYLTQITEVAGMACFSRQLEIIRCTPRVAGLTLLHYAYGEGTAKASAASLEKVLDGVFELASEHLYSEINLVLRSADPGVLAPEFLVGFPRITYRWRSKLPAWGGFVHNAIEQLRLRGGFDLAALFNGIAPISL